MPVEYNWDNPFDAEIMRIKFDATDELVEIIEDAIERLGFDRVCELIDENAAVFKQAVEYILYYIDSKGEDTQEQTDASLLAVQSVLSDGDEGSLMRHVFGNPENI